MPCITTLIRSSEITIARKHHNAEKNTLKCIKTRLIRSNGLKTHRPAKILHRAAIFGGCIARNLFQKTAGSRFIYPTAILKPPISCRKIVILRRIGSWSREPIIAKWKKPIQTIVLWSQKRCRNAVSSQCGAIVKWGMTVFTTIHKATSSRGKSQNLTPFFIS